jgi:DNA polymerase-1
LTETGDDRPLLLLDGMSLAFRAYFALSTEIATSAGVVTNALHGFASMLATLIKAHQPRALVVAFDLPGGTFRDAMTADYKGGRSETPEDLNHQFDLIRGLCEVLAIPVLGVPGFEADDVLATLATWGREHQIPTIVVTGDRDSFQLVEDPYIRVLYNRRGVTDYSLYDEAGIFERCGVEPGRYALLAALRGDPSDNLPGVPGVGEKTAAKLLATYADFDTLFTHLDQLTPKLRENLAANEQLARSNQAIMTLVRDVPLTINADDLHVGNWDRTAVATFFDRFEMQSMRTRFEKLMGDGLIGDGVSESRTVAVESARAAPSLGGTLKKTFPKESAAVVAFGTERLAALNSATNCAWVGTRDEFVAFAATTKLGIAGFDVKPLYRANGAPQAHLSPPLDDGAIMAFLLDSVSGHYDLATVLRRYLNEEPPGSAATLFDVASDDELVSRTVTIDRLNEQLRAEIVTWELEYVYRTIELPLVAVLGWMEARGIYVDREMLQGIAKEFADELTELDVAIQQLAGHPFKVNSPQQLQKVLYDELQLTPGKKIKTGFSTDATTLEALQAEHEIVPMILRFRELDKLRGTYGQSLIATIGDDHRIHATFHQTVARTGRLSSDAPNLHNIPVRSAEGRRLRLAFGPEPGWQLLVADYNQIELRVIAHLSQDPGLLQAFHDEVDVHRSIAAIVFHVSAAEVTHDQREMAKAVSYGLAYGMEAFGLSQRLAITVSEAKEIIDQYFDGFPTLRQYMDDTITLVRNQGYSRTMLGRIRPFPDLATATGPQRQAAERQAMNSGIQGLAADIFKVALVRLDDGLRGAHLRAGLVLQVHDEVVVEAPADEQEVVESIVRDSLANAAELTVPLDVSIHWGDNWASAKG